MSDTSGVSLEQKGKKSTKRRFGLPLIILFFLAMIFFNRQEPIDTVDCTPEIVASKPDVIMLGAWWCTYCYQAKKYFHTNNISYCEYDMENSERGRQLYEQHGGGAVPILLIGQHRLKGYSQQQVEAALDILHKNTSIPE